MLYVTLAAGFHGTIVLPYRVTDGRLFSNDRDRDDRGRTTPRRRATAASSPSIPGSTPATRAGSTTERCWVRPGSIRRCRRRSISRTTFRSREIRDARFSCVGWALGYAIKTYQERVELGWSLEPPEHRFSPAYVYNQLNGGHDDRA